MKAYSFSQPGAFHSATLELLASSEALFNLPLGILLKHLQTHSGGEEIDASVLRMAVVEEEGRVVGLACQEPPRFLLPAFAENASHESIQTLTQFLLEEGWEFPGLISSLDQAERIMETFNRPYKRHIPHACYELRKVIPPRPSQGFSRLATEADAELIFDWYKRFFQEIFPEDALDIEPKRSFVDEYIEKKFFYLWEDNGSQCMAAFTRPLPHGICLAYVYTPASARGKGYASNLVAAMSQMQLDAGKEYIALFADGDNLTSNKIYQQIGFQHIGGSLLLNFL